MGYKTLTIEGMCASDVHPAQNAKWRTARQYPEALLLASISATETVAQAPFQVISQVRIPKEILTDWGTLFIRMQYLQK